MNNSSDVPDGRFTPTQNTVGWLPRPKDLKSYFHFDKRHKKRKIIKWVNDDDFVRQHGFFPLIRYDDEYRRFRSSRDRVFKSRPIRYCARLDAAIFARFRSEWAMSYEEYIAMQGFSEVPIAYRKIKCDLDGVSKNNAHFARDCFDVIRQFDECDVSVLDISGFFESLDHKKLEVRLISVLGRPLSPAEQHVFKHICCYSFVMKDDLFRRLGMYEKGVGSNRKEKRRGRIDRIHQAKFGQLSSPDEFRRLVSGRGFECGSIIQVSRGPNGIAQGTPIADLMANIYMIEFDKALSRWVRRRKGFATRYSDDIVIVLPKTRSSKPTDAMEWVQSYLQRNEPYLKVKDSKVSISRFAKRSGRMIHVHFLGESSRTGLEYLGFRFDGEVVQFKDASLGHAWRKLKKRLYGWAKRYVLQYKDKGALWIIENANINGQVQSIIQTVSLSDKDRKKWTFMRYVNMCKSVFSNYETKFDEQTRRYRKVGSDYANNRLNDYISKKC